MKKRLLLTLTAIITFCAAVTALFVHLHSYSNSVSADTAKVTQGELSIFDPEGKVVGKCPLKHTDVKAEISGFISRVTVTQEFENPFQDKIEAVYVFPLSQNAAVDNMTMTVGNRTIVGKIKRREEARQIYEAARSAGYTASLLDQERPNIFTQSVANILPNEQIKITISYVEFLKYEAGTYEFVFPMVVGPRYIPGTPTTPPDEKQRVNTDKVPDATKISPPVTLEGTRAGHDISIEVALDAGVPIDNLSVKSHEVDLNRPNNRRALLTLKNRQTIPNKDFILSYDVAGGKIEDAMLTHNSKGDGFFTLIMQPPDKVLPQDVVPKEIVFVVDTSGSMMGFPLDKAKELIEMAINGLYERDTFNLITFSGDTHILFPQPVAATKENIARAQAFLKSRSGSGGTEMMKAIRASLDPSDSQQHLRIVCFVTDGYVGNDMEIISEIQKHKNARVFSFGIGNAINRFLLDKMAEAGRGEVEYVTLQGDGSAAAKRLHERVRNPLLTDISIDWGTLPVSEVFPQEIPDLFSAKPVVLSGRYKGSAKGTVKLRGKTAGQPFERTLQVELPKSQPPHDVLSTLWARRKIDYLMSQDFAGIQRNTTREDLKEAIIDIGLEYRLLTQFTSFVAVEETTIKDGGEPRKVEVPVEMPDGVSYEGIYGDSNKAKLETRGWILAKPSSVPRADASKSSRNLQYAPEIVETKQSTIGGAKDVSEADKEGQRRKPQSPKPASSKMDAQLLSVVERLKNKQSLREFKFVKDGKVTLQVFVDQLTPAFVEELKKLGFETLYEPKSSKVIVGRIDVEKLETVAAMEKVRYISLLK
ncbi:MAG: VWA domain-containing protein [Blastocatellia bacterium]|nr:VWA domain-containing protein [Blastocatellia bacterium]